MAGRRLGTVTLTAIADQVSVPAAVLRPAFDQTITAGYLVERSDGLHLTDSGEHEFATLAASWQEWVMERLADWNPDQELDLSAAMARLARRLFDEQPEPVPVGAR